MRFLIALLAVGAFGCANPPTQEDCKSYVALAKMIALQIAEQSDPASDESAALRQRWATIGELTAQAGCEHLEAAP